jgi:hypothetical protein
MPCDTTLRDGQTLAERQTQIERALARLEAALQGGRVKVGIAANGAVAFQGWQDRDDVTDVCAFRTLTASNSWALRQAVARAEATTGRKVNSRAVEAGWHSHDNGKTWGTH